MKQSVHAKRMARNHRRKQQTKLNLVSLMDIFTILVFFLLVNSSDVEVLQNNKSIQLPESVAEQKPENQLVILVSQKNILVNGRQVSTIASIQADQLDTVPALKKELSYQASRRPFSNDIQKKIGRNVTIMGDKNIPYVLLKKIMATCADTDYRNISLAVSQTDPRKSSEKNNTAPLSGSAG